MGCGESHMNSVAGGFLRKSRRSSSVSSSSESRKEQLEGRRLRKMPSQLWVSENCDSSFSSDCSDDFDRSRLDLAADPGRPRLLKMQPIGKPNLPSLKRVAKR